MILRPPHRRIFDTQKRVIGAMVAVTVSLPLMAGYWFLAQIRCCGASGGGIEWLGQSAMAAISISGGLGSGLVAAVAVKIFRHSPLRL